ncbi:competence/damage-inducible protein A [bacterium]|nr:competence/damage-inducible protein A [bacterium]
MKAEIISIGDELLIGQVVNTNAVYLSEKLTLLGIDVCWVTTIGDDYSAIFQALEMAETRSDVIIMTGGLGPTHDDVTKKIVCDYFKTGLVENHEVLTNVSRIFNSLGRSLDARNAEQALVPEKAIVLSNRIGTAPGLYFNRRDFQLFVLPGVPMEMKAIFTDHIQKILKKYNVAMLLKTLP